MFCVRARNSMPGVMSGPYANLLTESPAPCELVSVGAGAEENTRHFVIFALTRATRFFFLPSFFFFFFVSMPSMDGHTTRSIREWDGLC